MGYGSWTESDIPDADIDATEGMARATVPPPDSVIRTRQPDGNWTLTVVYSGGTAVGAPAIAALAAQAGAPAAPPPNHALDFAQEIVEYWEKCSLTAYHGAADRPDVWTIGWGCTSIAGVAVAPTTPAITQAQADSYLDDFLTATQASVRALVTTALTEYQEAALISFTYNLGAANLQASALLTLLNAGHFADAAAQFSRWINSNGVPQNGLIRRRGAEAAVFLGQIPFGANLGPALEQYADAALAQATA